MMLDYLTISQKSVTFPVVSVTLITLLRELPLLNMDVLFVDRMKI